jgi:hypothetical protein
MKNLEDLIALLELFPKLKHETPYNWLLRAEDSGLLSNDDNVSAWNLVRQNLYLWIN